MKKFYFMLILILYSCAFAKEPFCQTYYVYQQDVNAITVPGDKEFVLLNLFVDCINDAWQIDVNDTMWLMGMHWNSSDKVSSSKEFPDSIAIVESGKTLKLKKSPTGQKIYYTIAGYFRNADEPICLKYPDSDINKDCKVDLLDLALLAGEWLDCNLEPSGFCFG